MDLQLGTVFLLTFAIHLIATLAYGVRIAGVRTRRIMVAFALFNVFVLFGRVANALQAPLIAKRVESQLLLNSAHSLEGDMRWLIFSATVATILGALLIPSFHRVFAKAIEGFAVYRSVPRLIVHSLSTAGIAHFRDSLVLPARSTVSAARHGEHLPLRFVVFNMLAEGILTIGVFAALYAGYLQPQFRATASNLSTIITGGATILMVLSIDPYLSMMTDDILDGRITEDFLRHSVVWLVGSRIAGTLLAQALLLPAALLIALVARHL
jgi:Amj-like protein